MSKNGLRWVTEYDVHICYGGPEEGGWWYEVREKVQSIKFSTRRAADKYADKYNEEFEEDRRHGYDHQYFAVESKKDLGMEDNTNEPRPYYE